MENTKKNILFKYRRYAILVVLIFSSVGLFINTLQEWGVVEWWIMHIFRPGDINWSVNPQIPQNIYMVLINIGTIILYITLVILILSNRISVILSTTVYALILSTEIFIGYIWYIQETEIIAAYVLRDLIIFYIIIFIIATSANTFFTVLFSVVTSTFYILLSLISGNIFLIENIPIFIMLIGSFAFVFRQIIIILDKSIKKQEDEAERIHRLSQFKERMSYMLLHDIKVPLNSIVMLSNPETTGYDKKRINYQAQKVIRMLGNIVDVESGNIIRIKLTNTSILLTDLIRDAIEQVYYNTLEKNVTVKNHLSEEEIYLNGDRNLLERCLVNIIENAVKYSPENSVIAIDAKTTDNYLVVSVTDHGPGISKDEQEKIFELYYTSDENKQGRKSSGIGLTFCKMVTDAHEGFITLESDDNKTTFSISLPSFEKKNLKTLKYNTNKLDVLSEETLHIIKPLAQELRKVEYYQIGEIYKILNRLSLNSNTKTEDEIEYIRSTALSCNEKIYNELLKKISR